MEEMPAHIAAGIGRELHPSTWVHLSTLSAGGFAMLRFIMRMIGNVFKIAALSGLASLAQAQASAPEAAPTAVAVPAATPAPVIAPARERSWRLGAAFGYGERTNPLIQSDDIPVIVDVDIAWFGKRWFFDNGDVGFTLFDRDSSTTSLVARVNDDRVFFGKTNTRYVNFAYAGNGVTAALPPPPTGGDGNNPGPPGLGSQDSPQPVQVDPPDRNYAIEVGVESLLDGDWGAAELRAFHDVSGTHGGYELSAHYSRRWTTGRLSIAPTIGFSYKSAQMNDYYWGVHAHEANGALPEYHAGAGVNLEAGLVTNYYLTHHLRFALSVHYERLSDEIAASPLAEDDYVMAYFSGFAWTF
jgi:outer membrane protein